MGFLKDLGKFAGDVVGAVVSTPVRIVAEITDSKFLHESADMIYNATLRTGNIVGQAAQGVWDLTEGVITGNEQKQNEGGKELLNAVQTTAEGIGKGVVSVGNSVVQVGKGLAAGDMDMVHEGAEMLGKVALTGMFAVGLVDVVDGVMNIGDVPGQETAIDTSVAGATAATAVDLDASTPDTVPVETYTHGYYRSDGTYVHGYTSVHHDTPEFANEHIGDGEHELALHPAHPTTIPVVEHTDRYVKDDGTVVKGYDSVHHEIPSEDVNEKA